MSSSLNFLRGIRIADFTWAGAGPFCTKVFSDFGAEVIKVESSSRVDPVRSGGPYKDGVPGINRSGYFASRNSGKKSISLDLKSEEGKKLALRLIQESDVVTNNFGPGVMQRLGLGYDDVKKIKPDIIHLSMPMYGQEGPLASLLGVGMTISAVSGLLWLTAYGPDDPVGPGTHFPDHAANPYHAAFAILGALRYRRKTGRGMRIDLAQVESTINFVGPAVVEYGTTGQEPVQTGNRSVADAPHNLFKCLGDDAWCAIAVQDDTQWRALATAMKSAELLKDQTLQKSENRSKRVDEIEARVASWVATQKAADVVQILQQAGVPSAIVARSKDLLTDNPHLAERGYWQQIDHPEVGETTFTSPPYLIDGKRLELKRPPLIGEHTEMVLRDILGCDAKEIERLKAEGILQ
ncbi:MAG: CoA transferase [Alcaligenaceae bacterium]